MVEHWGYDFFKQAPAKARTSGSVTLSTTSDSQAQLDSALAGREISRGPSSWAAKQGFGISLPDGGTEREEIQIETDVPAPKPGPGDGVDIVGPMDRVGEAVALANYESGLAAARSSYADWDQIQATTEPIHKALSRMIVAGVINGPSVTRYLAGHPAELRKLNEQASKGFVQSAQRELERISVSLQQDPNVGLDRDDYRTFRAKRDWQIRSRR